jgi:hypothetical protein
MLSHNEVAEQIELQDVILNEDVVSEALKIEEVLNRAHQIHRANGGLIGYDLEDWLQAERELIGRSRSSRYQEEQTSHAEPLPWSQERNRRKCFGQSS